MINGNTEQFLDTGWLDDAELYYHGFVYWCDGYVKDNGVWHFEIKRWRVESSDNKTYKNIYDKTGNLVDYNDSFFIEAADESSLREKFLKSKVFDGKTFWEVEKDLSWVEANNYK